MNILFSQCSSLFWLNIIWTCNALFQALAWPQCIRLMNEWCSQQQLGTRWGLVSLSYQFGSFVVFSCFTFLIEWYGWRASFLIPGLVGMGAALLILLLPLDEPSSLGLMTREERFGAHQSEQPARQGKSDDSTQGFWEISREILFNRQLWYLSFAMFFLYIVKCGFCSWAPTFLHEAKRLGPTSIGYYMVGFEGAGAFGGLAAGWLSDTFFRGHRGQVAVLYFCGIVIFLLSLWLLPPGSPLVDALVLACLGFTLTGPQVMAGTASFDFSSKKAAVAANGFMGLFSGAGSAIISGTFLGYIAQHHGWSAVFLLLAGTSVIAAGFFWMIGKPQEVRAPSSPPAGLVQEQCA
jgi:sugar phosphate permease